jgi:hypothetical protein
MMGIGSKRGGYEEKETYMYQGMSKVVSCRFHLEKAFVNDGRKRDREKEMVRTAGRVWLDLLVFLSGRLRG